MITTTTFPHHLKPSLPPPLRRPKISQFTPPKPLNLPSLSLRRRPITITACSFEIDMVRTREGVYAQKPKKVVVLWDLDNKPPRGPPYEAALALKKVAQHFGEVVEISAYANRHAFIHLPQWVVQERRESRQRDVMERKGIIVPSEPYICSVCGRKCRTHLDLKKHFRELHERERMKKMNRMKQLKGKKRQRFKERFITGNGKYNEAARKLIAPKTGYGLASELRRAGVFVKTVEDKPQAADWALKRQVQHSMSRGIDWMFLISDDSDFTETLRKAREANLGTVVVGDARGALGRNADLWVPWNGVQNGEIGERDLVVRKKKAVSEKSDQRFSVSEFGGGMSGGDMVEELLGRMELDGSRNSAFSDGEEDDGDDEDDDDWLRIEVRNSGKSGEEEEEDDDEMGDYMLDSDDEDGYIL